MIICSSLSPNHLNKDIQKKCVASWVRFGEIYCFQHASEALDLIEFYPSVKIKVTNRTHEKLRGKSIVTINTMIDFALSKKQDLLIINSDILLSEIPTFKADGITCFQRGDYQNNYSDAIPFNNGWDAFYIPFQFLKIFPQSIFAMGACWWDYWIPYRAILNNVPIYQNCGMAFHKKHPVQYNMGDWKFFGEYFRFENSLTFSSVQQMGTFILNKIKTSFK